MKKALKNKDQKNEKILKKGFLFYNYSLLLFERLVGALYPFFFWLLGFIVLGFLGFFQIFPDSLKAVFFIFFIVTSLLLLAPLLTIKWPKRKDVLARIEASNGIPYQALQIQQDVPFSSAKQEGLTKALWRNHQQRLQQKGQKLKALKLKKIPKLYGLSFGILVFLGFASGFYSHFYHQYSLFDLGNLKKETPNWQFEAYVKVPPYSDKPPLYLSVKNSYQEQALKDKSQNKVALTVDPESELIINFFNDCPRIYKKDAKGYQYGLTAQRAKNSSRVSTTCLYQTKINDGDQIIVEKGRQSLNWAFKVRPQIKPEILIDSKNFHNTMQGDLSLTYQLKDNFGFKNVYVVLEARDKSLLSHALPFTFNWPLVLPEKGLGLGKSSKNFSMHPLAGEDVFLTIKGQTKKGEWVKSQRVALSLPYYRFYNPFSASLNEIRLMLLRDKRTKNKALSYLFALQLHGDKMFGNSFPILALSSAATRLSYAKTDQDLEDEAQYLWQLALEIEKTTMSPAKRHLKEAQEKLRQAIKDKAPPEEIAKLMQEMREAMQAYIEEFLKTQPSQTKNAQQDKNSRTFTQQDTENLLNDLESAAQNGKSQDAEKLLNQFSQLMDNLRHQNPRQGSGQQSGNGKGYQKSPAEQQMDLLGMVIEKQQQILNDTHRLEQKYPKTSENKEAIEQDLKKIIEQQQETKKALQQIIDMLAQNNSQDFSKETKKEISDALNSAKSNMEASENHLAEENFNQAKQKQNEAIEDLRMVGQKFKQNLSQKKKSGTQEERDPLGRKSGQKGAIDDGDNQIKRFDEKKRSRDILDNIRKFYQKNEHNLQQKRYYKRLLELQE